MEQLATATITAKWQKKTEKIPVQFNPAELTFTKGAQIAEINIPGLDSPLVQFVRGQPETLTLDLFFDTTESGMGAGATSVTTRTDKIYQLVKIDSDTHAPPVCVFTWNKKFPGGDISDVIASQSRTDFQCLLENIKQRFTLFSPEGVPLRAVLTVTFREYKTLDEQIKQLKLGSPDKTQSHVVQRGDTLSAIAAAHYELPGAWRAIADANGIDDPRRIDAGTFLRIPPIA